MYLVDTNVLSAGAPGRHERSVPLVEWMEAHSDRLFLSAVTVTEICGGIAKMRRTGSPARAANLADWLELVLHLYADRVLPFDTAAARLAGALTDRALATGHAPGFCGYRHRGHGREPRPHRAHAQPAPLRTPGSRRARPLPQPASVARHSIADSPRRRRDASRPAFSPGPPRPHSRDRSGDHPVEHLRTFAGILQADAYAGYNRLYDHGCSPGSVTEAFWAHGRRRFYELADIAAGKRRGKSAPPISPLALDAVTRIDALFDIERTINGESAERRLATPRQAARLEGRDQPASAEDGSYRPSRSRRRRDRNVPED